MGANQDFEDIRPYRDSEINAILRQLSKEPELILILKRLFPQRSRKNIVELLSGFHSVREFQERLIRAIVLKVAAHTTNGITISGFDAIKNSYNRLFISNHRDIILDAVFLNVLLLDNGRDTCEIAIGDNLFVKPWVERLVRVNKNIVVKRNITGRTLLEASAKLSAYIHYAITEKNTSVWIAQREGRAKNSDDRTQDSLLKMLNMGGKSNFIENMKGLNITPISISYEYDPCDYLKAKEFQQKRDNPEYKKTPQDDAINMETGIRGQKGRVHYEISNIDKEFVQIPQGNKSEQIAVLAGIIDNAIHKNYRIYPCNKIACDLLNRNDDFSTEYTTEEKTNFENYLKGQLDKIILENKDETFLRTKILEMYANPFINYLKATEK